MTVAGERLDAIRQRIGAAARRAGREPNDIRLIAVSKTRSAAEISALADLGVSDFGESQVQEAQDKIVPLHRADLCWHFIGHLQTNKARAMAGRFRWVHTVDSVRLAHRISAATQSGQPAVRILLQVNVARDPAKFGLAPDALYATVDELLRLRLPGIELCGLMTIGFRDAGTAGNRAAFADLREWLHRCRARFGDRMRELSMGMSGDFETAIEEGATLVRLGTALFGPRE